MELSTLLNSLGLFMMILLNENMNIGFLMYIGGSSLQSTYFKLSAYSPLVNVSYKVNTGKLG